MTDTLAELAASIQPGTGGDGDLHQRFVDVVATLWRITDEPPALCRAALASYLLGEPRGLRELLQAPTPFPPPALGLTLLGRVRIRLAALEGWLTLAWGTGAADS